MIKSLLEKNRSVLSNNVENQINTDLEVKNRLLPDESLVDEFSIYDQYIKERDECCSYRVILDVNPLCSNVLFNAITEIVTDEGSDNTKCLDEFNSLPKPVSAINETDPVNHSTAIRNTEYSHPSCGNFKYHCGVDIFNNHMLRKKTFIHVNKVNSADTTVNDIYAYYNTIRDYLRDDKGNIIRENLHVICDETGEKPRHLYGTDSLYTLKDAFNLRCREDEGWWGFTNPGTINIPNRDNDDITINEMLAGNKPCEFIDLYPDRSLFSFIPKYNNYRRRVENNWDYCITYPYAKDYKLINEICGGENGEIRANIKTVTNSNGIKLLQCSSYFKHNLTSRSTVNFYYYRVDKTTDPATKLDFQRYQKEVKVYSTGDLNGRNKDRIFSVRYDDIKTIYENLDLFGCFYKRVISGCESNYYVRIFKKLKNINDENLISDVNKAAFSKNIYGDDIAQIIFTDDVNLCGLLDENGREVSEVFLTVVKRNAGHDEWYYDRNLTTSDVEYSHCFGPLTSGIDFSGVDITEEPFDYNIHYLHNMDSGICDTITGETSATTIQQIKNTFSAWGETVLNGRPKVIEEDITIDNDLFYGDIVEFNDYQYETLPIANIFHRFNTMQREIFKSEFTSLFEDVITHDDYDIANNIKDSKGNNSKFEVKRYYRNDIANSLHEEDDDDDCKNLVFFNIHPEGYFYNPHSKIKLRQEGDLKHSSAEYINYDNYELTGQNVVYTIRDGVIIRKEYVYDYYEPSNAKTATPPTGYETSEIHHEYGVEGCILKVRVPIDFGFINGDYVAVYDKVTHNIYWGMIKSFKDMILTVYFDESCFDDMDILNHTEYFAPGNGERRIFMFWSGDSVPTYAKFSLNSKEFSWRPLLKVSQLDKNNELTKLPFSNGRIYVQKNINFFLRRQDPYGDYGLSYPLFRHTQRLIPNPAVQYTVYGQYRPDVYDMAYQVDNLLNTCY